MSECEYYQELISRMLDKDLSRREKTAVMEHLDSCEECAAMYQAFRMLSDDVSQKMVEPPEDLAEDIMSNIRRREMIKKNMKKSRQIKNFIAAAACVAVLIAVSGGIAIVKNSRSKNAVNEIRNATGNVTIDAGTAAVAEDGRTVASVEGVTPTVTPQATYTQPPIQFGQTVQSSSATSVPQTVLPDFPTTPAPVPTPYQDYNQYQQQYQGNNQYQQQYQYPTPTPQVQGNNFTVVQQPNSQPAPTQEPYYYVIPTAQPVPTPDPRIEQQRLEQEQYQQQLEQQRLEQEQQKQAQEQYQKQLEQQRLEQEQQKQAQEQYQKQLEQQRLEQEQQKQAQEQYQQQLLEQQRLAEQQRLEQEQYEQQLEQQRLAEQQRLEQEHEQQLEQQRLAEQQRLEQEQYEQQLEQQRLAEQQRLEQEQYQQQLQEQQDYTEPYTPENVEEPYVAESFVWPDEEYDVDAVKLTVPVYDHDGNDITVYRNFTAYDTTALISAIKTFAEIQNDSGAALPESEYGNEFMPEYSEFGMDFEALDGEYQQFPAYDYVPESETETDKPWNDALPKEEMPGEVEVIGYKNDDGICVIEIRIYDNDVYVLFNNDDGDPICALADYDRGDYRTLLDGFASLNSINLSN